MGKYWKFHKFGGSSLADADCFRRVADLMLADTGEMTGVVVSAMGGMTDALLELVAQAAEDDAGFNAGLDAIGERYSGTATALLKGDARKRLLDAWNKDAEDVRDVLKAIALVRAAPPRRTR